MANPTDPFSQLNDIQLPADPGLWPPAPGWWIVALVCLLLVMISARAAIRHSEKKRPVKALIRQLGELNIDHDDISGSLFRISRLVRRYAIHRFGREAVSPLQGKAWISLLDTTTASGTGFSSGYGEILGTGMYQGEIDTDPDELRKFLLGWARQQKN
jgi:hypothetical protein